MPSCFTFLACRDLETSRRLEEKYYRDGERNGDEKKDNLGTAVDQLR